MKQAPSPNFNERAANVPLRYVVLHYTGMQDAATALNCMCDPAAQVSAHYMIDEDGSITQLVDEAKRAWHAGKSFWHGITDMNSASIGIELVNPGHEFGYRPFPTVQIAALKPLLHEIIKRHALSSTTSLLAHSDIAPARKQDPGEFFPWQELAQDGLGLWPTPTDFSPTNSGETTQLLGKIGYDASNLDETVCTFQRRFHPENLTGVADVETVARLRAVAAVS